MEEKDKTAKGSIKVSADVLKKLKQLKLDLGVKSLNDVIMRFL